MKVVKFFILVVALALAFSSCGGKPKSKITLEEAKGPGRDAELFRDAVNAIRKGRFDEGRILLNTMINTYSESPLVKIARLTVGDSYYLEGGSKGLAQAEVEYREWRQFFPEDALADDVLLKEAEIHLRQVMSADRDPTHAKLAEARLKELLRRYPNTDIKDGVEEKMSEVQEILAMHELKVARFYFEIREAPQAAQGRTEEILNKYPNFSRFDEALWLHAKAMELQEDTETASRDLARIVTSYPNSEYAEPAKELLKKWGKPVPESDPAKSTIASADDGKSLPSRVASFLVGPKISTSNKGVIIDRDLKTDEIVSRALELGGTKMAGPVVPGSTTTTNSTTRPRRATGAGQDVEVRPGSPGEQKSQPASKDSKDKKDKDKKKNDSGSKLLRNP